MCMETAWQRYTENSVRLKVWGGDAEDHVGPLPILELLIDFFPQVDQRELGTAGLALRSTGL